MELYAVGDSFTAGAELADHEFFQDHPGFCNFTDVKNPRLKFESWYQQRWEKFSKLSPMVQSQIAKKELEYSYANRLADKLALPVRNDGQGGCAMQTIQRKLVSYLTDLDRPSIVILQPTHWTRWVQFYEHAWRDIMPGMDEASLGPELSPVFRFKIINETLQSWVHQWFINLYSCIEMIKAHPCVRRYRVLDAGFFRELSMILDDPEQPLGDLGYQIKRYIDRNRGSILEMHINQPTDGFFCPGGHYNYAIHQRLADQLRSEFQTLI